MRLGLILLLTALNAAGAGRLTLNFNPDWRFTRSDPAGAAAPGFDDRGWERVSTPHTFNDTDTFDHWSDPNMGGEKAQWAGRTWYRKTFRAPADWAGRLVFIEFEAARQVAEVTLNGHYLGASKTGFTPFGFDLTPFLRPGADNVLAVMCDNRFAADPAGPARLLAQLSAAFNAAIPESIEELTAAQIPWNNPRWHPAHGGLYRNVRLHVVDRLHIELPLPSFLGTVGPYAYAGSITTRSALVGVEVPVRNDRPAGEGVAAEVEVFDADGRRVLALRQERPVPAGARADFVFSGPVANPRFWEPDYPHLYRVVCTLRDRGGLADRVEIPLGIRTARWDPEAGLFLNGNHLRLHGWGQKPTDEWPGLGAAQPDWLHFFTLRMMKEAGGNFVRWGHSAAGPAQIGADDRLGLVTDQPGVDGESDTVRAAWRLRAQAFRDVIVYFRNDPSILIWEGGNQKVTRGHARELRAIMDRCDPHGGRAYAHRRPDEVTAEFMDLAIGTEGGREIGRLPVVEGEYDREESPRRVWDDLSPPNFGYPEARGQTYDLTSEQYAVNQVAQFVRKIGGSDRCGGANWIFSDSTSGGRVSAEVARASGEVDGVRLPKEAYYVCSALFRDDPQVHIIGHWSYPAGTRKAVEVVSNAPEVELFLNHRSLGRGRATDRYLFSFPDVAWEPGELRAVATSGGRIVAAHALRTAGPPKGLRLTSITGPGGLRADGSDIALVDVEAVDARGDRCPTFQRRVDFVLEGPGLWRGGYDSGKVDSINHPWLDLECGINRVSIRSTRGAGKIRLVARCPGLPAAAIEIDSHPFSAPGGWTGTAPASPAVALPEKAPSHEGLSTPVATPRRAAPPPEIRVGRFVRTFSYSGVRSDVAHVETRARAGANAYCDIDSPLPELPPELTGSDWVQAANQDCAYSAADLIQLALPPGVEVYIAHDSRVPPPLWLARDFLPTPLKLRILGHEFTVHLRRTRSAESLTLGSNREGPLPASAGMQASSEAAMYIVFVNNPLR